MRRSSSTTIRENIGAKRETPSNQVKLNNMYVLYKKYAKNPVDVKTFIAKCLEPRSFIFSKNMCYYF